MNQLRHILKDHPNTYQEELKTTTKCITHSISHLVFGGVMLLNDNIRSTGKPTCRLRRQVGGVQEYLHLFLTFALHGSGW